MNNFVRLNAQVQWEDIYNDLSFRQRLMVLLAVLSVIYFVWDVFFASPIRSSIESVNIQSEKFYNNKQYFYVGKANDSKNQLHLLSAELKILEKERQRLNDSFSAYLSNTILVADKIRVFEDVLVKAGHLNVKSFEEYPAEKYTVSQQFANDMEELDVYKNKFSIKFSANNGNVVRFLKSVEGLPWPVFFDEFKYKSVDRSNVLVEVVLYVVSMEDKAIIY